MNVILSPVALLRKLFRSIFPLSTFHLHYAGSLSGSSHVTSGGGVYLSPGRTDAAWAIAPGGKAYLRRILCSTTYLGGTPQLLLCLFWCQ